MAICILWGSSWAAVRIGLGSIPPILSLAIRFSLASIILGVIAGYRRLAIPSSRQFWKLAIILCASGFTIPFILIYWAQMRIDSGLASVLFATYPLWVALLSYFMLPGERITIAKAAGTILGVAGVIVIFHDSFSEWNAHSLGGTAGIIVAAIIQAYSLVALRKLGEQFHPVTTNLWSMLLSVGPLLLASLAVEHYSNLSFDVKAVGSLVFLAVFCTVCTFVIYFWLVKHVQVVILSFSALITPIIAIVIGVLFLDEHFTTSDLGGSLLVLAGVATALAGDSLLPGKQEQTALK